MDYRYIGKWVESVMVSKNLTQGDFAKKLNVAQPDISRVINASYNTDAPYRRILARIKQRFNMEPPVRKIALTAKHRTRIRAIGTWLENNPDAIGYVEAIIDAHEKRFPKS